MFSHEEKCDMLECYLNSELYPARIQPYERYFLRLYRKFRGNENVFAKTRAKKEFIISEATEIAVIGYFEAYRENSIADILKDSNFSYGTVQRILKKYKFIPRLVFCHWYLSFCRQNVNNFRYLLWTDESNFSNSGMFNRKNHHYWSRENLLLVHPRGPQVRFSFNVWCGIIGSKIVGPSFYEGTLTGERYVEFMSEILTNFLDELDLISRHHLHFQQDGVPAHNSRGTYHFLSTTFNDQWIGTNGPIQWPPRSPDLNPLDYFLWGYLKNQIYKRRYDNLDALKTAVREKITQIDGRTILKTVRAVEKRAQKCIEEQEESLLPVMEECLTSGQDFVFQQDGAACHTSKKTIKWIEENNVPLLKWVSSSPDLSPIETLWHEIKKVLRQHPARNNIEDKICFSNICGINSNIDAVHHYLQSNRPAVLFLAETKISEAAPINHLNFPNYENGGVVAFVRSSLSCSRDLSLESDRKDILWLRLNSKTSPKFICCLYHSPSNHNCDDLLEYLAVQIDFLNINHPASEVVLLGDFNAHNELWLGSNKTDAAGRAVEAFALTQGLTQLVTSPTFFPRVSSHASSLLDLFLTTHPAPYSTAVLSPLGNSDHGVVEVRFRSEAAVAAETRTGRKTWHYGHADWEGLRDFFSSFPWRDVCFTDADASTVCSSITEIIHVGMEEYIPHTVKVPKPGSNGWFNKSCDTARQQKIKAHRTYLQNPTVENRQADVESRNKYNEAVRNAKTQHDIKVRHRVMSQRNGSRSFWTLAKQIEKNFSHSSLPPLTCQDGTIVFDSNAKAEVLAKIFAPWTVPHTMREVTFRHKTVRRVLLSLDINKASGPDLIPAIVLKRCAAELAPVLSRLFQISYESGTFPENWKFAHVQPIPKKGSKTDPYNYRPIALLSVISKVMERCINRELLDYLERHSLISDRQYGFRHQRSTGDLLAYVTQLWSKLIQSHGEAHVVALDITKAFDQLWHAALLSKLPSYGLPEKLCRWVADFISGRKISVVIDGFSSSSHNVNAGVPQGSPISAAELEKRRLATTSSLTRDLEAITAWGRNNLVQFNASKTQYCTLTNKKRPSAHTVSMDGRVLPKSHSFRLVGVQITEDLIWHEHISSTAAAAGKKLGYLCRAKKYFSPHDLLTLYKAQIRPSLEYCSHIWGAAAPTTLSMLDAVQRRAVRLIDDSSLTDSLGTLSHRRAVGDLALFYRYTNGLCSSELSSMMPPRDVPARQTRLTSASHPNRVKLRTSRTGRYDRSFVPRVSRLWNKLREEAFPSSTNLRQFNFWCRQRSLWDQEWNSIVFSDESRFCLGMHDGRARVRRRRGERRNPQFFVERHVHHTVGVMVWGAIAYGSRSLLIFIRGNMNAQRYIDEILEPHLLPYLDTLADPTFQQDNARPHVARVTIDFFQHNDVTLLPWPPRSPDLSPIEHVWDMMGRRLLNLQRPPQTLEALREELVVAWNEIPQEDIDHLIRSMPRRVGECVAHQGASTHY
ncbi:unnamed protein product [Acanthoscelides obtectus]|uniref:Reverse transcriptase domain-containing protein n=2 Tax=Acanthoscelides obtectus TaxID=200917 RepID=A0A9P0P8Y4_ACAOB|nr:unnamed protein product [Acanthoscelides obtectus]CAK1651983.1 RNA-directed DNA polymerase from mobile element jockey [Acanthoscelides obtectus]